MNSLSRSAEAAFLPAAFEAAALVEAALVVVLFLLAAAFVEEALALVLVALVGATLLAASVSFLVLLVALAFVTLTASPEAFATVRISAAGFFAVAGAFEAVLVVADFLVAAAGLIAFG